MRVLVTETNSEDYTYSSLEINIDGKMKFYVSSSDDSPEDNNLHRAFSDCFMIPQLLQKAYEAGKNGEELDIEYIEDGEDY